jgi:integrase
VAKVLTQRGVESAKPKTERYGRNDGLVPGLRLIVYPTGLKSFALFTRVNGRLINHRIGDATVLSVAPARDNAKRQLALIAGGGDPRAVKKAAAESDAETVEHVARLFIDRHAKPRLRTWQEIEWRLNREVLPKWGRRPISSITRRDVIELLDAIVDRGVPVTANRTLTVVRKMFSWAIERSLIETSPFDHVKPPAAEVSRDRVLDDAELALVWQASEALGYPFGTFVQLLVLTGQRREEGAAMRWSELDLTNWTLPRERTKNAEPHALPVVSGMKALLADLPRFEGSDFVFTTNGRTPVSGFSKAKINLDAAIAELNGGKPIPPWRLHDIRRTFATNMAKLGVSLPVVEKLLNHVSGSFGGVAGIYQRHDFADEKRDALERWSRRVLELAS